MDFYRPVIKEGKNGHRELYPDFRVGRSKDLMVRGKAFYAIWDNDRGLWSTDEYDVVRLVDRELQDEAKRLGDISIRDLESYSNNNWKQFQSLVKNIGDNHHPLDQQLTFANTAVVKTDYVSRRLSYALEEGSYNAWDELIGTLYSIDERAKIEWTIGAIVSGDAKRIQKFLVFYGKGGTGKSTILGIVEKLFEGYVTTFEAKALAGNNNTFATESFRHNPLVAIQHDGDLSRMDDNTKLNSIIAHENMTMNEKYKASYTAKINAFLLMGTNQVVKITDAKSGIIRRLIDVKPTGVTFPNNHYNTLMGKIDFELGAIAYHCLQVYLKMGKNAYSNYRPTEMILKSDVFFNFIEACYDIFKAQDSTNLRQAWALYKEFCADVGIDKPLQLHKFRSELENYFDNFEDRVKVDGVDVRSYYSGFNINKFKTPKKDKTIYSLVMDETTSIFDKECGACPAQYSKIDTFGNEIPIGKWSRIKTTLSALDTSELHFVKVPINHIVIDFDLTDVNGTKSLERNLEAASAWPPTYAELSKSGNGVHLHYFYDRPDIEQLGSVYSNGIEIKSLLGDGSLRRRLTKCNNLQISTISTGLPLKEKKMLSDNGIKSEKGLRDLVTRNLKKEIHAGTKPSIDFIFKILDDAYKSGIAYDLTDMRARILAFANNSSNRAMECLKIVQKMQFASETQAVDVLDRGTEYEAEIAFFDVEVYPNLFVVCWKPRGGTAVVRMVNPSAMDVEALFKLKLVGFNNRAYDNHILYARYMGYNNTDLFTLSQKMINNDRNAMFGEGYNLSYADIFDFSAEKKSLKKFGVELGLHHMELNFPWDQPVATENWDKIVEYCVNDVELTEAVFEDRYQDFVARQILAELSGLPINKTTKAHTAQIIFGKEKDFKTDFVYTDLRQEFPGYVYDAGVSSYRGDNPSEGGYVYAEPGLYENVTVLDVASMHPTSIEKLNLFGPYTQNFTDLKEARLAIKRKDYARARTLLDGKLVKFLGDDVSSAALSYALKIIINIVYGLTMARYDNAFKDPRNKDNIVAKRGALFMIDLKHEVQARGYVVAHIKTDSIKIPNATAEIIDFITRFGAKYGYEFELEGVYDKFCLVNDAVYIARKDEKWEAVGAQFQHPYVYKTLFTREEVTFDDLCETKSVVSGTMYLDFAHVEGPPVIERMHFIGRIGRFVPVIEPAIGARLYRIKDNVIHAVTGTKNHLWVEATMGKILTPTQLDMFYYEKLCVDAIRNITKFGEFRDFVS